MIKIVDYLFSLLGYEKKKGEPKAYSWPFDIESLDHNFISRTGALKMRCVADKHNRAFLLGGFCIVLDYFDMEREFYGMNVHGWNGTCTAKIDGNGKIILDPEIEAPFEEFLFSGEIFDTNFVPYETVVNHSPRSNGFGAWGPPRAPDSMDADRNTERGGGSSIEGDDTSSVDSDDSNEKEHVRLFQANIAIE